MPRMLDATEGCMDVFKQLLTLPADAGAVARRVSCMALSALGVVLQCEEAVEHAILSGLLPVLFAVTLGSGACSRTTCVWFFVWGCRTVLLGCAGTVL